MLRYVRAAFWASPEIKGLGRVPVNAVVCLGAAVLGLGLPAIWLAGVGLEVGYLTLLASHPRFQRWVDARDAAGRDATPPPLPTAGQLSLGDAERVARLHRRCAEVLRIYTENRGDDLLVEGNREALAQLADSFARLLVARARLDSPEFLADHAPLRARVDDLERDLADGSLSKAAADSKRATLQILRQRLANIDRREELLEEIDSDLARIEAQVDLAWENAALHGKTEAISGRIDLASRMFLDGLGGESWTPEPLADGAAPHGEAAPPRRSERQ